jgi:hypothetical protein
MVQIPERADKAVAATAGKMEVAKARLVTRSSVAAGGREC